MIDLDAIERRLADAAAAGLPSDEEMRWLQASPAAAKPYRKLIGSAPTDLAALVADVKRLRAVVAALPRCSLSDCDRAALWMRPATPEMDGGGREAPEPFCDEHRGKGCGRPGCCDPEELPYAAALRALEGS